MKIRQCNYLLAFLATGAVLSFSILVPALLLTKDGVQSRPSLVKIGNQQNSSDNSNSTGGISPQQQFANVSVFVKSVGASTLASDQATSDIGMEDAVKLTLQRVTDLLKTGTIPALAGFPNLPYNVNAQLRTIADAGGHTVMQYWNMDFIIKAEHVSVAPSIIVSLDARTGLMLSLRIVASGQNTVNLTQSAITIARGMNMQGKVISMTQNGISQNVLWKFTASRLTMSVSLYQKDEITFLNEDMGTD